MHTSLWKEGFAITLMGKQIAQQVPGKSGLPSKSVVESLVLPL